MKAYTDTQINGGGGPSVFAGVTLRECSVVIIGSTCRICGRDFKCESDVSLHTRWRHNGTIGSLIDALDQTIYLENAGQKCDVCDMHLENISDLKFHKRLIHKQRPRYRKRRRKDTIRVIFKLNGITTTDINLDRKYLRAQSDFKYFADAHTPDSLEKEKRQDKCAANIDLSLPDHVVDNSRIQYSIRPHKDVNRYIVGKFTSTKGDAIALSTVTVGRSLAEISNTTPNRDAILGSDDSCEEHENRCDLPSHESIAESFIKNYTDSVDIHNKENSGGINERERKNLYCQSEILSDVPGGASLTCQRDKFDKTASFMSKQNARSNESNHCPNKCPNEISGNRENLGLTVSSIDSIKVPIDNKNSYNLDGTTTLQFPARLNGKASLVKANSNNDDDVQEVLRITRGNAQSDINHESPNRTEREMLIQNAIREMHASPMRQKSFYYPENRNADLTANVKSPDDVAIRMVKSHYFSQSYYHQVLANAITKKMGFNLENLHRYGIRYYNDIPEINNNDLEKYEVHAQQDFLETWMKTVEPQYTSRIKANDNEIAVVID